MKSVILISSNNKEVANLFQQWKNKATNIYVNSETLNMVINGEYILIIVKMELLIMKMMN